MSDYPGKTKTCQCGHTLTVDRKRIWCEKCGQPVYYHDKEQKQHRMNHVYVIGVIAVMGVMLTYLFMEMVATPLMSK